MIRPCDIMTVSLARLIRDGETVFHGVSSHIPMIAVLLAKKQHAPNAVHLNIPGGVDPGAGAESLYQRGRGTVGNGLRSAAPAGGV